MQIIHDTSKCAFVLLNDENKPIGRIDYVRGGHNDVRVPHTEVNPAYEGQGLAGELLDALVAWAAEEGLRVIPVCSYALRAFQKHPEKYAAVMK